MMIQAGRTIYHIDSVIRETNTTVDDGLSRVFVNTQYADTDNTDVGKLMKCFLQKKSIMISFQNYRIGYHTLRMMEGS